MGGRHARFGVIMVQLYGKENIHFKMQVSNVRALRARANDARKYVCAVTEDLVVSVFCSLSGDYIA